MFTLFRFSLYAWRFERAVATDNWESVARCFREDAVYEITGAPPMARVLEGRAAIVAYFRHIIGSFDRRFDVRKPSLTAVPGLGWNRVSFAWRVHHVLDSETFDLHGSSVCRYNHGRIQHLRDELDPAECRVVGQYLARFGASLEHES